MRLWFATMGGALLLLLQLPPLPLEAQSCCAGGASTPLLFVLPPGRTYLFGIEVGGKDEFAYRDQKGALLVGSQPRYTLRATVGGAVRLTERTEFLATLPWLWQYTRGESTDRGSGIGDGSLVGRARISPGSTPSLFWDLGVLFPTGRAPEESSHPLGMDITGSGKYRLSTGIELLSLPEPIGFTLILSGSIEVDRTSRYRGWGWDLSGSLYELLLPELSLGVTALGELLYPDTGGVQVIPGVYLFAFYAPQGEEGEPWVRVSFGTRGGIGGRNTPATLELNLAVGYALGGQN